MRKKGSGPSTVSNDEVVLRMGLKGKMHTTGGLEVYFMGGVKRRPSGTECCV